MRKPRLYLETSVWNFLFADDAPEKKAATEKFFKEVEEGKYEIYISEAVRAEIAVAPADKRKLLFKVIRKHAPATLEWDENVEYLADMYIENGVLSGKHYTDLIHLAYATVNGIFALISWNLNHLVKMKTINLGNAVNLANGYPEVQIYTPEQVIEHED